MKYTIAQFRKDYPDDVACLRKLLEIRYEKLGACPECGVADPYFVRVEGRRCYRCEDCHTQFYPTAGTIFEKTTTPLSYWFYAMYLMIVTRNGVAAKELQRVLGVSYKTAWRMARQIRLLMSEEKIGKLFGEVQADECFVGGKERNNRKGKNGKTKPTKKKAPVFAMVEKKGRVFAMPVENVQRKTLFPKIQEHVEKDSTIYTDEMTTYITLSELGYHHESVKHSMGEYVRDGVTTNAVEGFFSQLKRMIGGSYVWVSTKHLHLYVNECVFRYNNRNKGNLMFNAMLFSLMPKDASSSLTSSSEMPQQRFEV